MQLTIVNIDNYFPRKFNIQLSVSVTIRMKISIPNSHTNSFSPGYINHIRLGKITVIMPITCTCMNNYPVIVSRDVIFKLERIQRKKDLIVFS